MTLHFFYLSGCKHTDCFPQSPLFMYLGNQVRIEVQRLPKDALHAVLGLQLHLGGHWLFLHKVKKRLHLPSCES